ncbi:MAG TPA: hypothetical protein VFM55_06200 [Micromonosporaceae bacterium]|nr:hypothetical protein [Micromonosporaceae bacterium]
MTVSINTQAFHDCIPPALREAAAQLRRSGSVGDLEQVGGGVQAVVRDGRDIVQPWVGVVDRAFTSECECSSGDDLCVHAVAVALTAFDDDVDWSGAATPPSVAEVSAEQDRYATAVERLARRQLTALVVAQATKDELFATTLLREAGMLDAADDHSLRRFAEVLEEVAGVTSGSRWQIHDIETAGERLVAEVEILCAHPATPDALDLVEQAIVVWDDLSGYLADAHYMRRTDPEEVGEPLVEAHLGLCEQLDLAPAQLAERLAALMRKCQYGTLDIDSYADLLGDHIDALHRLDRG